MKVQNEATENWREEERRGKKIVNREKPRGEKDTKHDHG